MKFKWLTVTYAVVLLTALNVQAQDFSRVITWQATPKTFTTIDGKTIVQPTFKNAVHTETANLLPLYEENIAINSGGKLTAQLVNAVYTAATGIDNTSAAFIKGDIELKAGVSYTRKKPSAYVQFSPFRKNSAGQIEKLESFTLRISVTPQPQKRADNAYKSNSVLASGNWYKIAVTAEGMYKVDYNFIKSTLNINPESFNLSQLAIFGNGGGMVPDKNSVPRADDLLENPTMVVDNNNNNKFDQGDYLLFYGQMPDEWQYTPGTQTFRHYKNLYSDKTYYFLTPDAGTGKRVSNAPTESGANTTITEFDEHAFHETDDENMLKSGKIWLGDKMTGFNNTKNFSFSFPNLVTTTPVKFGSSVGARTGYGSSYTAAINGTNVITRGEGGVPPTTTYPPGAIALTDANTYNASSDNLNVTYTFNITNDPSGGGSLYIDWFELQLKRRLTMAGDFMPFRSVASVGASNKSEFRLENANANTRVWNITALGTIQQMPGALNGTQLSFTTSTPDLIEFIAFNTTGTFTTPEYIEKIPNQDLHSTGEPDMVILTYDDFEAPSNELADFHRTNEGISVNVIKLKQVYNEFGSGKPDISAIRDYMRMLYDRAGNDTALMTRYLLLMGDGSYDQKGRIGNSNNFVPTYQSYETYAQTVTYTSDDFYGLLDPNEGGDISDSNQKMDVAIGRLPVGTVQEAWDVVAKIKGYKRPSTSGPSCIQVTSNNSWRNIVTFIGDDEDQDTHLDGSEAICESTRAIYPVYNYDKIYLDAYKQLSTAAGDRYPDVNTAILNKINSGSLIINWIGHGGETNWAHERIFNMADIVQLQNKERLPLFVTATCEFSRFDLPDRTAGEWLITNGKGGAIASITTVRLVYSNANEALNGKLFDYMFEPYEGRNPTLGELILETKNTVGTDITNTRKFVLLGDPALQLNYPRYNVTTTKVNNQPIALLHDTLRALSQVTIEGEITDDNNNVMTSFNGVVYPVVYDKISTQQTLGNDPYSPIRNIPIFKNLLFKGKASVTAGKFSFTFIVPKDIDYNFGKGRISYYADNGNFIDGHGFTNDIVIGGAADSFANDAAGPKMNIYMNDEKFVFGGITNESPMLVVKMEDESGINTAGNGIGHDLNAVLDNNTQSRVALNDYYESELDNYKKGSIKYPFSKLAVGRHTLKVKSWDIHNNSSEDYTEFVVASDAKLALAHVFNYPNPFTTRTQFMLEHNRPCDQLSVSIRIYTVSGKVVKSIQKEVQCDGFRVNDIEWDGRDDYGDAIGKGVYVYKVDVRDTEGNAAHKFEKLVVLR